MNLVMGRSPCPELPRVTTANSIVAERQDGTALNPKPTTPMIFPPAKALSRVSKRVNAHVSTHNRKRFWEGAVRKELRPKHREFSCSSIRFNPHGNHNDILLHMTCDWTSSTFFFQKNLRSFPRWKHMKIFHVCGASIHRNFPTGANRVLTFCHVAHV